MLLLGAETVLNAGVANRERMVDDFGVHVNMDYVRWDAEHSWAIIHKTNKWVNKKTGKKGGPRFGVVGIKLWPKTELEKQSSAKSDSTLASSCWGVWQADDQPAMKLLELFAGTGSVSHIAQKIHADITSVDINVETAGYSPTIVHDILTLDYQSLDVPDIITASPPCQTYSIMSHKHRTKDNMEPQTADARLGLVVLEKTVEIIKYFTTLNPKLRYYIENPVGRMQYEPVLKTLPGFTMYKVTYCKFGFDYKKPTHIFTNDKSLAKLLPLPCSKANPCAVALANGGKHPVGVREHEGQPAVGKGLTGKAALWERYRQPPDSDQPEG